MKSGPCTHRDPGASRGTRSSWQPWISINARKTLNRKQTTRYNSPNEAHLYHFGMVLDELTLSPFSPFTPPEGSMGIVWPGGPGRPSGPLGPSLPGKPSRPYIIHKHTILLWTINSSFWKINTSVYRGIVNISVNGWLTGSPLRPSTPSLPLSPCGVKQKNSTISAENTNYKKSAKKNEQLPTLYLLSTLSPLTLKEIGKIRLRDQTVRRSRQEKRSNTTWSFCQLSNLQYLHQRWGQVFITHLRALNVTMIWTWNSLNKTRTETSGWDESVVWYAALLLWFSSMLFPLKSCLWNSWTESHSIVLYVALAVVITRTKNKACFFLVSSYVWYSGNATEQVCQIAV